MGLGASNWRMHLMRPFQAARASPGLSKPIRRSRHAGGTSLRAKENQIWATRPLEGRRVLILFASFSKYFSSAAAPVLALVS